MTNNRNRIVQIAVSHVDPNNLHLIVAFEPYPKDYYSVEDFDKNGETYKKLKEIQKLLAEIALVNT